MLCCRSVARRYLYRVILLLVQEHVAGIKARSVETIVTLERNAEELPVAVNVEFLQLTAMPVVLSVSDHVVGEFDVIAG